MAKNHTMKITLALAFAVSLPLHAETQILACSYFDKFDASTNSSFIHAGLPWVWAKGFDGEPVYVTGKTIDGFFEVSDLASYESGYFKSRLAHYQNSTESARILCRKAISEAFPDNFHNKELISMMVKSSFLSIYHLPPVFEDLEQRGQKDQRINKIIIFGDSLSDQINLKSWLRIMPGAPYFGGRFTNGPNWVDYLHLETGVAIQNWAVGGAVTRISEEESQRISTRMSGSVEEEIRRFQDLIEEKKVISDPEGTLFVVWAGGNDYLSKLYSKNDIKTFIDEPGHPRIGSNAAIAHTTENIIDHVRSLYEIGARKFLVMNLPDLGTMPKILDLPFYRADRQGPDRLIVLSRALSQITIRHNQELNSRLNIFIEEYPDAQVIYGDSYSGFRNVVLSRHFLNPSRYFSYQLDPDFIINLGKWRRPVQIHKACFTGGVWGGEACATVCPAPNHNLFWDAIHPSSFGHCLIALNMQIRLNKNNLLNPAEANNYLHRCRPELSL